MRRPADQLVSIAPTQTEGVRRPRVAVVVAAGRASRLSARTGGASNVTLQLGGMSLMERVVVVLGHGADAVERCLDGFPSERVESARAELAAGEQRLPDGGGSLRGQ